MTICITHIDWTALGTLITAIATVGLGFATYFTTKEMKRQREQSSMPNLVLRTDKRYYLYRGLTDNQYLHWHENSLQDAKLIEAVIYRTFYLDLFNIGVGSAKEVKFNYNIDANEMTKFLNGLGNMTDANLDLGKEALNFNANLGNQRLAMNAGASDISFSHVFVPKSDEMPFSIAMPMIYLYMFNAFLLSILAKEEQLFNLFDKFPSINLSTSYKDIANKIYYKNFKIRINIQSMTINTDRAPSHISGIFKIEEQ